MLKRFLFIVQFGQAVGQHGDQTIDFFFGDNERGNETQYILLDTVDQEPLFHAVDNYVVARFLQFQGEKHPDSAGFFDNRVVNFFQTLQKISSRFVSLALLKKFFSVSTCKEANAAEQARGLPPKVAAWVPGTKDFMTRLVPAIAPMATPPAMAFASVIISGFAL